jgi:PKD domain
MRRYLLIALSLMIPLTAAGNAQAVVVNDGGTIAGVSIVPITRSDPFPTGVSAVTSGGSCNDPWLSSDLGGPLLSSGALCYRGGPVINKNETFALTWDQQRAYWSGTRGYAERFLRDVADGSGKLSSPFAVTQQYNGSANSQYPAGGGRAENTSTYGGGCIDNGTVGGSACDFGASSVNGAGHDFPANACKPSGGSFGGAGSATTNTTCLSDAQLQGELQTMIQQTGIASRTSPGYTPLVTLLMPPGVVTCLDAPGSGVTGKLCSANGDSPPPPVVDTGAGSINAGTYTVEVTYLTATGESLPSGPQSVTVNANGSMTIAPPPQISGETGWNAYVNGQLQNTSPNAVSSSFTVSTVNTGPAPQPSVPAFCSYHSQVNVGGTEVAYVVQPWNVGTACDEPDSPPFSPTDTPQVLAAKAGMRLVSPLSESQIAAIVDPALNGWFASDGSEIDDNGGCAPLPKGYDSVNVGSSSQNPYLLQREFNNAGVIESDPNTYFGCAPGVLLQPEFVVPSAVNPGDEVQFDGSVSASTLIVPKAEYKWQFGDGATATGPSVVHSYTKGGTYTVTLTITDRGGNTDTLSQTVTVLGGSGNTGGSGSPGSGGSSKGGLQVHILLMPQSLHTVIKHGVDLRVTSNAKANGIAWVSIPRRLAKRAHIKAGHKPFVVIGVGTVSGITDGTVSLHLKLSRSVAAKLRHLRHVTLAVRLSLVGVGGNRVAVDAAGRY